MIDGMTPLLKRDYKFPCAKSALLASNIDEALKQLPNKLQDPDGHAWEIYAIQRDFSKLESLLGVC